MLESIRKTILYFFVILYYKFGYTFDLIEVWQLVKENSIEYKIAKLEVNMVKEQVPQARALLLPQISLNSNYQNNKYDLANQFFTQNMNNYINYGFDINVSQTLFNLNKFSEYKHSKIISQQSDIEFEMKEENLLLEISKIYFDILFIRDSIVSVEKSKKFYLKQIDQAKAMHNFGMATGIDIHEAQNAFDQAQVNYINLKSQLIINEKRIRELTKIDPKNINFIDDKKLSNISFNDNLEYWQNLAKNNNIEIRYYLLGLDSAKQHFKSANYDRLPNIDLNLGLQNKKYMDSNINHPNNNRKGTYIVINFSMPLFKGGLLSSKVKQARK